ncbi:hypothetical protein Taro_054056 [Colocasia esculenta]|uniref:Glycosyltransferase n=1 Tax=Colocasia esculenta TaxID=4460 RepID=A0A843XPY0_COLES|nr:hypothetical protein [Colocasia esculenta]
MCHPWTRTLAEELGVPRLAFHGTCCFALLCYRNLQQHIEVCDSVDDEMKPCVVPGLPHRIEITREQAPAPFQAAGFEKFRSEFLEAEETSHGVVFNTFCELEPLYLDNYQKVTGKKVWAIGPVCLYNNIDVGDRAARGNKPAVDGKFCLSWLDGRKRGSVVFVSFGSVSWSTPSQIIEIGMGLEASGHPFILVIKAAEQSPEVEEWLLQGGFEERTKERSLVIRGWPPQMAILSHPAVGGFVSHCGWNSTAEAISAGLPMLTWPFFGDQFLNERLVVDVLGVGVCIGVKRPAKWGVTAVEEVRELVKREVVEAAVRELMEGGVEGQQRRERAALLGQKARKAMEARGSSDENLARLIRDVSLMAPHASPCDPSDKSSEEGGLAS